MAEPRILADLKHPNIVDLIALEKKNDNLFMVMEYLEGESLERLIQRKRILSPLRGQKIAMGICSAIVFAHAHNVTHRNICPANIIITCEGVPKLFGLDQPLF